MEKRENSLILETNVANRYSFSESQYNTFEKLMGGFGVVRLTKKSSEYFYL